MVLFCIKIGSIGNSLSAFALTLALWGINTTICASVGVTPAFTTSEIEGQGTVIVFCDLDGDSLKDAVLVNGTNIAIYFQDASKGFPRVPQQQFHLYDSPRAALLWPARLGRQAESLIAMTSDGVTQLDFTNRASPPTRTRIIQQQTIIPDSPDGAPVICLPFIAEARGGWPLLLVPIAGGLQVWQHREEWRQAQFIPHAIQTQIFPFVTDPGYGVAFTLDMNASDVNGDGFEDLMFKRNEAGGMQTYTLYLQQTNGVFSREPVMTCTNKADEHTALYWTDINKDGKLDLIKSTMVNESSFVPVLPSGKVFVTTYLADDRGRIPAEQQQIFRKNDWCSSLPIVDLDGDGLVDLVLGTIPLNTREGFRKAATVEQVDLNLKFYFGRQGGSFPQVPDCQRDVVITFHSQLMFNLDLRYLYSWQFVSLSGDFNGDGKKDLLVADHHHEFSVYFFVSREAGFSPEPDIKFSCPEPMDWWDIKDLNGDGVSDLVVKLAKQNRYRIFTSRKK